MPIALLALLTLRSMVRSRAELQLENLALRHQVCVLQRSARKRSKLTPLDRLFWVFLIRFWSNWRSTLVIGKPETVVAWHRKCFRLFWTWKVQHGQPGRPVVPREVRDLRQMCQEIPPGVRRAFMANSSSSASISARPASASTWYGSASRLLRLGVPSSKTTSRSSFPSTSSRSRRSDSRFSTSLLVLVLAQ